MNETLNTNKMTDAKKIFTDLEKKATDIMSSAFQAGKEKTKTALSQTSTQAKTIAKEKAKTALHQATEKTKDFAKEKIQATLQKKSTDPTPTPSAIKTQTHPSSSKKRVAINGFGRIGRQFLRLAQNQEAFKIVAINDLTDPTTLAHLLEFDSTYGRFPGTITATTDSLTVNDQVIKVFAEKDPTKLPWKDLKIDIVIESTGVFRTRELASAHLTAGTQKIILSAPAKSDDIPTVIMGVNEATPDYKTETIFSAASCTTNCLTPLLKVIQDAYGIKRGSMVTVHSVTNDQKILDLPHHDLRRARSASQSIIPTTTGAATTAALIIPNLAGKIDGYAIRVNTPTVSLLDLTLLLDQKTTAEELNQTLRSADPRIIGVENRPLVSIDYRGDSRSAIIDAALTRADRNLIHLTAWYDNEWGYSSRLVDFTALVANSL